MSKTRWKRCPHTGVPLSQLERVPEEYLTVEGNVDVSSLSDCNVFCVNSIAALCEFRDPRYFRDHILNHPDYPIHVRRMVLRDENGMPVVTVVATHQSSAEAGGNAWHQKQEAAARERASASRTDVSSGSIT